MRPWNRPLPSTNSIAYDDNRIRPEITVSTMVQRESVDIAELVVGKPEPRDRVLSCRITTPIIDGD